MNRLFKATLWINKVTVYVQADPAPADNNVFN